MTAYHITERDNLPSILKFGLRPHTSPAYEHEGAKAVFLTRYRPTSENILGWEDLFDPVILVVELPKYFTIYEDEAGMEIYPEVEPIYTTRTIPARYIQMVLEVPENVRGQND